MTSHGDRIADSEGNFIIEPPPEPDNNYPLPPPGKRVLVLELKRSKDDKSEASPILTALLRCNTCASFCGTREQ